MARNNVREAVQGSLEKKLDVPKIFYGWLGNADDVVEVPGRLNYVYVTMSDGMVTQAYNVVVPNILNLPVICGYDQNQLSSGLLKVLSVRNIPRQTASTVATPNTLVAHHASHEWMNADGGTDTTYIELRQFMPLRPSVIEPYSIHIDRGVINLGGTWRYVRAQTFDLSGYIPTTAVTGLSGSSVMGRYVLVSLNATSGSPSVTSGSLTPITTISLSNIPATPAGHYPLCAVYTYYYQEKIVESRTKTDLIDLRYGMFDNSGTISVLPHNNLTGLQGGASGSYMHLTGAQWVIATNASGSGQAGYLTATDWLAHSKPDSHAPVENFYLTGYDNTSGSFSSGSVSAPASHTPVANFYLTGYDLTSGSFSSGSVAPSAGGGGTSGLYDYQGVYGELVSGSGTSHTAANVYVDGSLRVYINGVRQDAALVTSGSDLQTFTTTYDVQPDDVLTIDYAASGSVLSVPQSQAPVEGYYFTGYDAASGSFSSGSVVGGTGGSQVVPVDTAPVENFYLTGYDATSGSFSSGSVAGGGGVSSGSFICAIYSTSAGQTLSNGAITIIDFENKLQDTHDAVTSGSGWKFSVPAGNAGFYMISSYILFNTTTAWADGEIGKLNVFVSGSVTLTLDRKTNQPSSGGYLFLTGTTTIYLNEGEYVDIRATQGTGGNLDIYNGGVPGEYNRVCIAKIGTT